VTPIMSSTTETTTSAGTVTTAASATTTATANRKRLLTIAAIVVLGLIALGVLAYFLSRAAHPTGGGGGGDNTPYTPLPANEILPSGRYKIQWGGKQFLTIWPAGELFGSMMLDPSLTLATAPEWTYDATARTLTIHNPRTNVENNAIYWPASPDAQVYLIPAQYLSRAPGATLGGWALGGPSTSVGASPHPTGAITNTVGKTDIAFRGLTVSYTFGLPEVVNQSRTPSSVSGGTHQWAFYPSH